MTAGDGTLASAQHFERVLDIARSRCDDGASLDAIVAYVHRETGSFIRCVFAAAKLFGLGLGEAKARVHHSPALAGGREDREAFWVEAWRAAEQMTKEDVQQGDTATVSTGPNAVDP